MMKRKNIRVYLSITFLKQLRPLIWLTISAGLLYACGSTGKSEEKLTAENTPTYQCYGSFTDTDSVFLKLTFLGKEVNGELTYKLFEKDKNHGTLKGIMHGDTLLASYQFTSEGLSSTREVAFLKRGNELVEGFAPMDQSGTHFLNKNDIDFAGIVLQPGECHD